MPVTVFSLQSGKTLGHLFIKFEIERTEFGIFRRQRLQDFRQPADYPTVAASPENLLAVGFFLSDVAAVAIYEILLLVVL